MTIIVLRLRSSINNDHRLEKTMTLMRLTRVNHCTVVTQDENTRGMLKRMKDMVTWGELEPKTLAKLLRTRANIKGGLSDIMVSENTEYKTVDEFAEAVVAGKAKLESISGLKNLFRLHPPIGGHSGIKKPYNTGGSLGYRGTEINSLLENMLGPLSEEE